MIVRGAFGRLPWGSTAEVASPPVTRIAAALAQIVHDEREGLKDIAEDALYTAVENGEPWAIQFCLKGVGKDRGHNEKIQQELTGAAGGPVRITTLSDERLAELLMKNRKPDVNN